MINQNIIYVYYVMIVVFIIIFIRLLKALYTLSSISKAMEPKIKEIIKNTDELNIKATSLKQENDKKINTFKKVIQAILFFKLVKEVYDDDDEATGIKGMGSSLVKTQKEINRRRKIDSLLKI